MTNKDNLEGESKALRECLEKIKMKESKLEYKSVWRTSVPYVPGAVLSQRYRDWISKVDFKAKRDHIKTGPLESLGYTLGALISASSGFALILGIPYAIGQQCGTLNPEIQEQRNLEKEIQIQKEARNYLDKYDANKNYVLDSAEFIKFYKEKK